MALSHRIVVMNKGMIEQIGTPTEIYDHPVSRYVASFIGEMNFIKAENGIMAVRPENVTIKAGRDLGEVNGIVRTIMILGHYVEVHVQVEDTVIKSYVDREIADGLKLQDEVSLSFISSGLYTA